MQLVNGTKLTVSQRQEALAAFPYRWTHENAKRRYGGRCPACVQRREVDSSASMIVNGVSWHEYHSQLMSDEQWLARTEFWVTKSGRLAANRACVTN